jgi:sterol desaturase/sphingolipid hydroxylase (fatty acid hydroxylase superfamily)
MLIGSTTAVLVAIAVIARPDALIGLVVLAAVLVPVERRWPVHRRPLLRAGWRTDVAHFVVSSLLAATGVVVVVVLVGIPMLLVTPQFVRDVPASWPAPAQFVVALGVADVSAYWAHRAAHQVPALWRFHKVHHASASLDWLAAAHLHPLDQIFIRSCAVLPLVVLGFSRTTFGAYLGIAALQAIVVHANIRMRVPVLRWLVATPEYHHWHHGTDARGMGANFGAFPAVDAAFGTLHLPRRWPNAYGVGEPQPVGYLAQLRWPFAHSSEGSSHRLMSNEPAEPPSVNPSR